jgi:hypothetical protein
MSSSSELNKAKTTQSARAPVRNSSAWSRTRPRPRDVTVFALATVPSVAACSSFARVSVRWGLGLGLAPAGIRSGHGSRDSRQLSTTSCSRWGCKRPAQAMLRHGFAWRLDPSLSTRGPDVKATQGGGDSFLSISLFGFGQALLWLDWTWMVRLSALLGGRRRRPSCVDHPPLELDASHPVRPQSLATTDRTQLVGLPLLRRKIRTGFVALLLVGTSDAFGWWLDILMRGKCSLRFA